VSRAPRKPPLKLDMDFDEAMRRFAKTSLSDLPDRVRLKRTKQTNKPISDQKED